MFLTPQAEAESFDSELTKTYPTTWWKYGGGPTVDAHLLVTSNGRGGPNEAQHPLGSTSHGEDLRAAAMRGAQVSFGLALVAAAGGAMVLGRALVQ